MFNLPVIDALAADTVEISVTLSPNSVTLILAMVDTLTEFWRWRGSAGAATDAELDRIDAMIGTLVSEIQIPLECPTMHELPVGSIFALANTTSNPTINDWTLYCNGATYTKAAYPELWDVLGTPFRIDANSFHVPDLRSRFIYGAGSMPTPIGMTGGAETHTLSVGEIPAHTHTQKLHSSGAGALLGEVDSVDASSSNPIDAAQTGSTGGGGSHNNMPPYMTLKWYIVAKPSA